MTARATKATWIGLVLVLALGVVSCSGEADEPRVASLEQDSEKDVREKADAAETDAVEQYLEKQQEFVDCVRENGHPAMRDPDEFGAVLMSDLLAVEGETLQRIMKTCEPIIAGSPPPPELAERQQEREATKLTPVQRQEEIDFAKCMQENGVPEYPDPQPNGLPRTPEWELPDVTAPPPPGLPRALDACLSLRDGGPEDGRD